MPKHLLIALALLTAVSGPAWAQRPDTKGSSDYPLLSRFEGSTIDKYEVVQFDRYALPLGPAVSAKSFGDVQTLEGRVVKINYAIWDDPKPSLYQLYQSYGKALAEREVEVLFSCFNEECKGDGEDLVFTAASLKVLLNGFMGFGEHAYIAARMASGNQNVYAGVYLKKERSNVAYELHFIEIEAMDTSKISMADITKGMEKDGKQAFYGLYFETGSANLKNSSLGELELLADYLRENPDADYFIVGHTDNVGSYTSNRTLANARAQSVITALQEMGVSTENLAAVGVGPVSPVASNATEGGRAQNRRVELVLK
ncbi:MAG: OmpA family protein [Pseudomonadota bacterium]